MISNRSLSLVCSGMVSSLESDGLGRGCPMGSLGARIARGGTPPRFALAEVARSADGRLPKAEGDVGEDGEVVADDRDSELTTLSNQGRISYGPFRTENIKVACREDGRGGEALSGDRLPCAPEGDDDADRRAHWAAVYANRDFVEGFASKFRPLLMTQEVKLLQAAPWGPHP